ncbi:ADP-ribosyltransferase [Sphingobacterium sp. LRF_L2]|uniref:ADP-ribosyltransferase n=1 Tax=Sphingobacterium sp. LRF_L2 TaxID=3369421 RepID=UPI003F5E1F42
MIKSLQKYVSLYLSKELKEVSSSHRNNEHQELDVYEKTIIYKYTEDGYESVNNALRKGQPVPLLGTHLINSLKKIPNYKRLCYRAAKLSETEIRKYYEANQRGTTITEPSFLSCSKSKSIALAFCQSPLFIILSKHGKDIEKIAKFGIYSGQNEKEILFKPGSKFRVLDISGENKKITITLEEV